MTIVGIVGDFHMNSLHSEVAPVISFLTPEPEGYLYLKLRNENIDETIEFIEEKWSENNKLHPIEYRFLDQSISSMYQAEKKLNTLFSYFSLIIIFISTLGLLGLVTFSTSQRIREISIRKVLGASVSQIILLMNREFLIMILIANIIAIPLAWYGMSKWLSEFVYRIEIQPLEMVLAAVISLGIALITISLQSLNAAQVNPIENLRNE